MSFCCRFKFLLMKCKVKKHFPIIIIRMFCPRAVPSLQAQESRLQFCWRQVFHLKLRSEDCSFTRDWMDAVAFCCFPNPTLSFASEQTLKDLKRSQGYQRGDESGFGQLYPSDFTEIRQGGLNISSIRVFDKITDPEIPITLRPRIQYT